MSTAKKLLKLVRSVLIRTRDDLVKLCAETTRLTIERDASQLALDEATAALIDQHSPGIETLKADIERNVNAMEAWARANRATEFKDRQGITVGGCALEFRKGTGKVECQNGDKETVKLILSLPDEFEDIIEQLIRIKTELNKDTVKRLSKSPEGREILERIEARIVVEETFSFTPARDDLASLKVEGSSTEMAA